MIRIHREGVGYIFSSLFLVMVMTSLAAFLSDGNFYVFVPVGIVGIVFFALILNFFRNPDRPIQVDADAVLAPCDGKVVVVEETREEEWFEDERRQISIFMSPVNVHVTYAPVSGMVKYFQYHSGKYLMAWHPKSSTLNERTTVVAENEKGVQVLFRQIAGALAKRIRFYVKEGGTIQQGKEFGFIRFGSRVDVFLPLDADVQVGIGDKTVGGITVLAKLNASSATAQV